MPHRCPIVLNFDVLEKRWTVRILRQLYSSPMHFNELKRRLRGITPAVLAGRLKELERRKLLKRSSAGRGHKSAVYSVTPAASDMFTCWGAQTGF
ncbi:MAG: helix-turn-helix domain-containing protein [Candidatus Micrarchaeota archaeon]